MARPAKSVIQLRNQINKLAPHRDQKSDGIIGDAAHKALGNKSDHNDWFKGIVTAIDIDHSPEGGMDCDWLWNALIKSGDARIKYIIFKRRIINLVPSHPKFNRVREYTGLNAHTLHLHLSVRPEYCDMSHDWKLWIFRLLVEGMWNEEVEALQKRLNLFGANLKIDGNFGPITAAAVRAFQRSRSNLTVDAIVGPATKRALGMTI
jgi:hypothetical protein